MIIWIASYPRSGNTFFRVFLNSVFDKKTYSIYNDLKDIGADKKTSKVVGHENLEEGFDVDKARKESKLYIIKTHEPPSILNETDKTIYLIRDGRDSSVSYLNYINQYHNGNTSFQDILDENITFGGWSKHVSEWSPKHRKNTFLIHFEELVKEPQDFIKPISDFLNIKPINSSIPTFTQLQKLNPKFFRAGKINSWEKAVSKKEILCFWLLNYQQMNAYDYIYKRPNFFGHTIFTKYLQNSDSLQYEDTKGPTKNPELNESLQLLSIALPTVTHLICLSKKQKSFIAKRNVQLSTNQDEIQQLKNNILENNTSHTAIVSDLTQQVEKVKQKLVSSELNFKDQLFTLESKLVDLERQHNIVLSEHELKYLAVKNLYASALSSIKITRDFKNKIYGLHKNLISFKSYKSPLKKFKAYKRLIIFLSSETNCD